MKVDGSLVSLIQGVSQQPPRERFPGQCSLQENLSSNPVTSLTRRPPFQFIDDMMNSGTAWKWDDFTAQDGERYFVATAAGALRIFGTDGAERTVTAEAPLSYLTGNRVSFEATYDGIFVSDSGVTTELLTDVPTYHTKGSIVFLLGGQYGRTYRITVTYTKADNTEASFSSSFSTPDGSSSSHAPQVATENIATQLHSGLSNAAFSFTRQSDVILINRIDGVEKPFSVTVDDGDGGANIFAVNGKVGDVGKLPRYAPHKYLVTVTGTGSADEDDWYLEFLVADKQDGATLGQGFGKDGVWRECTALDQKYKWNKPTMPHVLYLEDDGSFTFSYGEWEDRKAGDDNSNPPVSLLGKTINDLSTFQSRLAMASGAAVVMSRTDKPLNLWKQSATTLADDDPIDVESTAKTYSEMQTLTPFNRDLVVFSDKAQFVVFGRSALTPKNSALVLTCSFEAELRAPPQAAGRNVFFAINSGSYTGIKEFYSDGSQDVNDSRPITQHVKEYLVGRAKHMASTSNFDTLLVMCDGNTKAVYAYEYLWVDDQRAQSSWSTWKFSDTVEYFLFEENIVYFVFKDGTRYYLASMDLDTHADDGLTYQVKLDNRCTFDTVNLTVDMPYPVAGRSLVVVQGPGCPNPGLVVQHTVTGANQLTLKRSMNNGTVYVGERYLSRYKPTMPQVKDQNNVKVGTGKLTVRRFLVQYEDTGFLKSIVTTPYTVPQELQFSGRILGAPENRVGEAAISSGHFDVPYRHSADKGELEIQSDSHLPMTILDIEWVGQYTKKGQRLVSGGN